MKSVVDNVILPIRSATCLEQVEEINNFFNSAEIKEDLHWFTYRDTLERAFEREDRELFFVRDDNGNIIGALMVWCESRILDDPEAQIRLVAVSRAARGENIGRHLCEEAEKFAEECEKEVMIADVVKGSPAVEFWKSIGYTVRDEWETNKGTHMLTVEKVLNE